MQRLHAFDVFRRVRAHLTCACVRIKGAPDDERISVNIGGDELRPVKTVIGATLRFAKEDEMVILLWMIGKLFLARK